MDHSNPYIHSTTVLCDIHLSPPAPPGSLPLNYPILLGHRYIMTYIYGLPRYPWFTIQHRSGLFSPHKMLTESILLHFSTFGIYS